MKRRADLCVVASASFSLSHWGEEDHLFSLSVSIIFYVVLFLYYVVVILGMSLYSLVGPIWFLWTERGLIWNIPKQIVTKWSSYKIGLARPSNYQKVWLPEKTKSDWNIAIFTSASIYLLWGVIGISDDVWHFVVFRQHACLHIYRVSTITLDTLFFAIYWLPKHLQ